MLRTSPAPLPDLAGAKDAQGSLHPSLLEAGWTSGGAG